MDIFNKKRFTFWTIVVLIALNISTISMLWLNQKRRPAENSDFESDIYAVDGNGHYPNHIVTLISGHFSVG